MKPFENNEQATAERIGSVVEELQDEAHIPSPAPETPTPPKTPPSRLPLTHRTAAKVTAFILCIMMLFVVAGSAVSATIMLEEELYTTSEWTYKRRAFENLAKSDAYTLIHYLQSGETGQQDAMNFLADRNIAAVNMTFSEGAPHSWGYDGGVAEGDHVYSATWYHMKHIDSKENFYSSHSEHVDDLVLLGTVDVTISLADTFIQQDQYFFVDRLISIAYALRYAVFGIGVAATILAIACFIFLLCASGRKRGLPDPQPGWGTKVPIDLLTALALIAACCALPLVEDAIYFQSSVKQFVLYGVVAVFWMVIALGWCMSFALRIKLGSWWKNSIVYYALRLAWHMLKALLRGLHSLFRGVWTLLTGIPLVWKTALAFVIFSAAELFVMFLCYYESDNLLFVWALTKPFIFALVLYIALSLRKLQKGGEAIAAGDLSYQVDTRRMLPDFLRHGENLNSIGQGMTAAVEQRLRSERMKTELITNVSHDIKTPLTSIINYADLIGKEPCENEAIHEYAAVLYRQSERLKRLIDDLVEASKASTGNLEVLLAPCEVGVLLTQTAGEYEQRLQEHQLTLITTQPEQPLRILADGRRLWRVIDNLMNNICKYGQSGTRVYLTLEEQAGQAVITFRNTSREPLNLTADAFMERFVQGDSSRASDGNGLGLSIAKSLTELQNGSMELMVDGDLFKVILKFPVLE